jgi:hypothetical protein
LSFYLFERVRGSISKRSTKERDNVSLRPGPPG